MWNGIEMLVRVVVGLTLTVALYAPLELTRVILIYRTLWPEALVAHHAAVEVCVIWFPWVAGVTLWRIWGRGR